MKRPLKPPTQPDTNGDSPRCLRPFAQLAPLPPGSASTLSGLCISFSTKPGTTTVLSIAALALMHRIMSGSARSFLPARVEDDLTVSYSVLPDPPEDLGRIGQREAVRYHGFHVQAAV